MSMDMRGCITHIIGMTQFSYKKIKYNILNNPYFYTLLPQTSLIITNNITNWYKLIILSTYK